MGTVALLKILASFFTLTQGFQVHTATPRSLCRCERLLLLLPLLFLFLPILCRFLTEHTTYSRQLLSTHTHTHTHTHTYTPTNTHTKTNRPSRQTLSIRVLCGFI